MFIHYSVIARLTRLITRLQVSSPFFLWSCRAPFVLAGALHTSLGSRGFSGHTNKSHWFDPGTAAPVARSTDAEFFHASGR
jgi:hypothetical protein